MRDEIPEGFIRTKVDQLFSDIARKINIFFLVAHLLRYQWVGMRANHFQMQIKELTPELSRLFSSNSVPESAAHELETEKRLGEIPVDFRIIRDLGHSLATDARSLETLLSIMKENDLDQPSTEGYGPGNQLDVKEIKQAIELLHKLTELIRQMTSV